jgi:predicted Zn finger-like uncharacterized protein
MKITCQACQAKYTIADEKVVGKVVKIRCKKCGASIVINGNESATGSSAPPPGGGGVEEVKVASWTVNVAEGDQRTMTEAEIVDAYRTAVVNDDTFCWREGMADWLSLQEIAPLYAACAKVRPPSPADTSDEDQPTVIHDGSAALLGAVAAAPRPAARPSDRAVAKDGNGAGAVSGPPPAATVAARRAGGRGTAADLFGGAARAGGDDEVMTSLPANVRQQHPDKATGARNENSVLFELKGKEEGPPGPAMVATNEASGLIDIRQLSAQMHSSAEKREKNVRVDDIMNLGAAGGLSPGMTAPLLSAPSLEHYSQPPPSLLGAMGGAAEAKNKALVFLALGAGTFFLVAAIGIAMFLVRGGKESASTDQEKTTAAASASAKPGASTSEAPQPAASASASAAAAPEPTATESATAQAKETKETSPKETSPAPVPMQPKVAAAAPVAKETNVFAPAPAAAPAAEFNMGEARSRLAAVAAGVQTCKRGDTSGSGRVEIVFAPSGAVQSANLMAGSPFDGTPTGKCVEARFRGARVPAFGGSPFTVTKSFSIN